VSGSNCCRHDKVYVFLRQKDGSFAPRREVMVKGTDIPHGLGRAVACPHLLDWDRDGHTDLVIGYLDYWKPWTLYVGAGPLAGKDEVLVKPFALPEIPDAKPVAFGFADWDGDGRFDLLVAVRHAKEPEGSVSQGIYWFRNLAERGEPKFAPARPLVTLPTPWQIDAFTVVDRGQAGGLDLLLGVHKNYRQHFGTSWGEADFTIESQLWLYRQKP
jgi:hypothetical protein